MMIISRAINQIDWLVELKAKFLYKKNVNRIIKTILPIFNSNINLNLKYIIIKIVLFTFDNFFYL